MRRFPAPWTVEAIDAGFKIIDANGQSLAYVYGRETKADADIAKMLTMAFERCRPNARRQLFFWVRRLKLRSTTIMET